MIASQGSSQGGGGLDKRREGRGNGLMGEEYRGESRNPGVRQKGKIGGGMDG